MKGVFTLTTPADLVRKLRLDYSTLEQDPNNPYLAFNFFVTAEHLLDWIYPGYENKAKREAEREAEVLLQICSHLASGAKHFVAEAKHHTSVSGTVQRVGNPLQSRLLNSPLLHGGGIPGLCVNLEGKAKDALGSSIQVARLAVLTLKFWENHAAFRENI